MLLERLRMTLEGLRILLEKLLMAQEAFITLLDGLRIHIKCY